MILRPDRPPVCCPPGSPGPANGVGHVVVASLMRSGTHLLLDLILNNFSAYRSSPLYLDLEQYRLAGLETRSIHDFAGLLIKTHFPHTSDRVEGKRDIEPLVERYPVVMPVRNREDVVRSMQNFGDWGAEQARDLDRRIDAFDSFWSGVPKLTLPFEELVDPASLSRVVGALERHLGVTASERPLGTRPKTQRRRVLADKALTRLLGARAPRINTTIGFAR